jgi:hypothetical protein
MSGFYYLHEKYDNSISIKGSEPSKRFLCKIDGPYLSFFSLIIAGIFKPRGQK